MKCTKVFAFLTFVQKPDSPLKETVFPVRRHLRHFAQNSCLTPTRRFFSPKKPSDVECNTADGVPNIAYETDSGDIDWEDVEEKVNNIIFEKSTK